MIRVRAFSTVYPHMGAHSGFRQVLRYLDPSKVTVTSRQVSDSDEDWPLPESPLNARLRRVGERRGMTWYKLSDLAAELRALPACLANTIDIVHFLDGEHTGQFLQTWIRRSRLSHVRTIATYHQPPELLCQLVNPDSIRQLDLALAVSPTQVAFLRDFLPPERVRTLLHGVDTAFFQPGGGRAPRSTFKCITTGHWLRDWPAVRAVAERLRSQDDVEFHIVTNRPTGLDDLPNVTIHRSVSDERLLCLYQDADALLLPLTNATANNSLLEGLACGLPVVSTRLASVQAYVDDGAAYLVDENDTRALVQAVRDLQKDAVRRAALSRAARARAETLAWPSVAGELQEIYDTLGQVRRADRLPT
jgi:glycosyltransferase involved in cell wall biosynthesis